MFDLDWPWVFLCLPLPYLFWKFLPALKNRAGAALKVPFLERMSCLSSTQTHDVRSHLMWPLIIWILLLAALSGPKWVGAPIQLQQEGRSIMMAVDLSGSMQLQDMSYYGRAVSRLDLVKSIAGQFIKNRQGDRIGLVLFGSRAYLQTPLTRDLQTVVNMLDDATVGLAGSQTAIGDGIGLAIKRLMHYPKKSRVLVLLTDGQNNAGAVAPLVAAKMAAKADIKIYTIGLGSSQMVVNTPFGPQYISTQTDLDETMLKQIAKLTGGEYFRAASASDLQQVYDSINKLEFVKADQITFRPMKLLYPWPLGFALILSVVWLLLDRRRVA
ncbi:MAG: hypothetical protein A3F17_04530 [Gammaproteobacteria bacterium RIFCSPHIGHO2_12_FULL_41_15]|nr:MAG: hypothetical protein A3F17_04530 [Gammaproteobacteria bacterium RIFCSPHIGHO2_12_FULL_41_15]